MSAKNVDRHNRFRSITVGFRVSPEEQEELNRAVALSGLPKQEYCYRKCMGREVVVQPNPRVHKALKTQMMAILAELERIAAGDSVPDELLSTIDLIAVTMQGLKGEVTFRVWITASVVPSKSSTGMLKRPFSSVTVPPVMN